MFFMSDDEVIQPHPRQRVKHFARQDYEGSFINEVKQDKYFPDVCCALKSHCLELYVKCMYFVTLRSKVIETQNSLKSCQRLRKLI